MRRQADSCLQAFIQFPINNDSNFKGSCRPPLCVAALLVIHQTLCKRIIKLILSDHNMRATS